MLRGHSSNALPNAAITVAAFLDESPSAAAVFLAHRMACVGCSLARFDTLAEAARSHAVPLDAFLHQLARAASSTSGRIQ